MTSNVVISERTERLLVLQGMCRALRAQMRCPQRCKQVPTDRPAAATRSARRQCLTPSDDMSRCLPAAQAARWAEEAMAVVAA